MRAGLTVERLVEAGGKLADQQGFEAVTPSALAKLFNVKVASLYSHIASAHDLKVRVALFALDRLADQAAEELAGRAGKDALLALANVHRRFAQEHPGLFVATRFPLDGDVSASGGARIARLTRAILRDYPLAEPSQTHAVRLLGSAILGFVTLELAGSFSRSAPAPQVSWEAILDALDATLRAWSRV